MKALAKKEAASGLLLCDVPDPVCGDKEVIIEVKRAAICGTDIHYFNWDREAQTFYNKYKCSFPFVLGHECAGVVVDLGNNVSGVSIGDKVSVETHIPCMNCFYCLNGMRNLCRNTSIFGVNRNGCFSKYTAIDADVIYKLDEEISYTNGCLMEPAGVAMKAVLNGGVLACDTVIVIGCGPIGLFSIQILQALGVNSIIALDINEEKIRFAKEIGADAFLVTDSSLKRIKRMTAKRDGADLIIETSGSHMAYEYIFDLIRGRGRIITVGHPGDSININIMRSINFKEVSIQGVFGRDIWKTWNDLSSLISQNNLDLSTIATRQFALKEYKEAFKYAQDMCGKVIFNIENE